MTDFTDKQTDTFHSHYKKSESRNKLAVAIGCLCLLSRCDWAIPYCCQSNNYLTLYTSCVIISYSSSADEKDLTIHEQAVWMILSKAEIQSPSGSNSASMVDSLMLDSTCMSVSALDGQPDTSVGEHVFFLIINYCVDVKINFCSSSLLSLNPNRYPI